MSESVKQATIEYLRRHSQRTSTEPVFIVGGVSHFAEDLIREIENDTDFGKEIIDDVIKTAVDMFVRGNQ